MPEEDFGEAAEVAIEAVEDEARSEGKGLPRWALWASLSTMVMALFSATGGLLAGTTANDALIERDNEINQLIDLTRTVLQAEMLRTHVDVLESMGRPPPPPLVDRLRALEQKSGEHAEEVFSDLESSDTALHAHEIFAIATTLLSVAMSLTGMSVIVRRRWIWTSSLALAAAGVVLLSYGLTRLPG